MTSVAQGASATLEAQFYEYAGGPAEDLTGVTITITPSAGGSPVVGPTSSGITHAATGLYAYTWAVDANQTPGDYLAVWQGTDGALETIQASEVVTVISAYTAQSTWALAEDVTTYTGATVTDGQLHQAQALIDLFTGRPYTTSTYVTTQDRYWLKLAVAYQAAWIIRQPDLFSRMDFTSLTQDGNTMALKDAALLLAPAAARSLKKVTWLKSRSLHVRSPFLDGPTPVSANPVSSANDRYEAWSPMPGWGR